MSRPTPQFVAGLFGLLLVAGCQPHRPAYRFDQGDLNYYVDQATEISYPDVESAILDEVTQSHPPVTNAEANFTSFWDLTLEDAVAIALQNSKVIRGYGTPGLQGTRVAAGVDNLANGPGGAGTIYNVAIRESEPGFIGIPGQIPQLGTISTNTALDANQGVEAALADFDAQLTSNVTWSRQDQPRNVVGTGLIFQPDVFQQDLVSWTTQVAKNTANGTQLFARTVNSYTKNTIPVTVQPLESVYQAALEFEIRQPLLRGRGAYINRMPVVISRINTDQQITNFEATMQNMVTNVEIRYWDLYCAFRNLETAKSARDAALETWRAVNSNYEAQTLALQDEAQARGQYYTFRAQVEQAWVDLLIAEGDMRYLLGVASTDGRLIRPIDEPTKARVSFDWCQSMDDALIYRPELRQERWELKKRELALAYSKNSLLPNLNATALYRWLGLGDQFTSHEDNVPVFPQENSGATNELLDGEFQEFSLALDFGLPIGFRRELSNVRNAQLKVAQELARLEDMELDVSREMTQALQALEGQYHLAQTSFQGWAAYTDEYEARNARSLAGSDAITTLLDSQRFRAQLENAYYQAICEYNKMIALIHRRKGTILAYNGISLGEGAWPEKAYVDASENARRRGASREVNYGFTRPEVISQGAFYPTRGDTGGAVDAPFQTGVPGGWEGGSYYAPSMPSGDNPNRGFEEIPATPTPAEGQENLPIPQPTPQNGNGEIDTQMQRNNGRFGANESSTGIDWNRFGLSQPDVAQSETEAVIRQVSYEEIDR